MTAVTTKPAAIAARRIQAAWRSGPGRSKVRIRAAVEAPIIAAADSV